LGRVISHASAIATFWPQTHRPSGPGSCTGEFESATPAAYSEWSASSQRRRQSAQTVAVLSQSPLATATAISAGRRSSRSLGPPQATTVETRVPQHRHLVAWRGRARNTHGARERSLATSLTPVAAGIAPIAEGRAGLEACRSPGVRRQVARGRTRGRQIARLSPRPRPRKSCRSGRRTNTCEGLGGPVTLFAERWSSDGAAHARALRDLPAGRFRFRCKPRPEHRLTVSRACLRRS
jgi:hypothetical protein